MSRAERGGRENEFQANVASRAHQGPLSKTNVPVASTSKVPAERDAILHVESRSSNADRALGNKDPNIPATTASRSTGAATKATSSGKELNREVEDLQAAYKELAARQAEFIYQQRDLIEYCLSTYGGTNREWKPLNPLLFPG